MSEIPETQLDTLAEELSHSNLALFVGAGLSLDAGMPSWHELVKPLADDLGLRIGPTSDLLAIAQYHVNDRGANRGRINDLIKSKFTARISPTRVHRLLASLPFSVIWTTNYDHLLEDALEEEGKIFDVKSHGDNFSSRVKGAKVTLYKMHGDAALPERAILTKEDYEKYHVRQTQFLDSLRSDLVQRTFLFLGISFSDYNVDYVLGRVRAMLGENQRQHYYICASLEKSVDEEDAEYSERCRLRRYFLDDLLRYGINTIEIPTHDALFDALVALKTAYAARSKRSDERQSIVAGHEILNRLEGFSAAIGDDEELVTILKAPIAGTVYHSIRRGDETDASPLAVPGRAVRRNEPIFLIESNQRLKEIVSPFSGTIVEVLVQDDVRVAVPGAAICLLRRTENGGATAPAYHLIRAPYDSTFYVSNSPNTPPLVTVNQVVDVDYPVCTLEVQKHYQDLSAGAAGRVRFINFNNRSMVQQGECLFILESLPARGSIDTEARAMGLPFKVQVAPISGRLSFATESDDRKGGPANGDKIVAGETIVAYLEHEKGSTPIIAEETGLLLEYYRSHGDHLRVRDPVYSVVLESSLLAARKHFRVQLAGQQGIFRPSVRFGEFVQTKQTIGYMGEVPVPAKYGGVLLEIARAGGVEPDDVLARFTTAKRS